MLRETKLVNNEIEYAEFVASILNGWKDCWKTKEGMKKLKEVHGTPENFPCVVVHQFEEDNDPEGYGPGFSFDVFGEEKLIKTFVSFRK
jgi:hypothetical protein